MKKIVTNEDHEEDNMRKAFAFPAIHVKKNEGCFNDIKDTIISCILLQAQWMGKPVKLTIKRRSLSSLFAA